MPLPLDMPPPPKEPVPYRRRAAYARALLDWPPGTAVPWLHLVWISGVERDREHHDSWLIEARHPSGRHILLTITDDAARKLLRRLHAALPDEPLGQPPPHA
jgi:hypothetical protein